MKLELKHLTCYLPYELKMRTNIGALRLDKIDTIETYQLWASDKSRLINKEYEDKVNASIIKCKSRGFRLEEVKPMLRPLSSLTKEITVNGETFVPMVRLAQKTCPVETSGFDLPTITIPAENKNITSFVNLYSGDKVVWCLIFNYDSFTFDSDFDNKDAFINQLDLLNTLHSWHFDLYCLIEAGLAEPIED